MRFLAYVIFAYIALGAQVGLAGYVRLGGAPPNLVLLAVLFVALHAPRDIALLAGFGLGLMQDLLTQQTLGLFALSYGVFAAMVAGVAPVVNKEHPVTHVALALLGSVVCAAVIFAHGIIHPPGVVRHVEGMPRLPATRISPRVLLYMIGYTTVLAPILLAPLSRMRGVFGFQAPRRRVSHSYSSR
jgi:rod shape-determining protein MreD